LWLQMPQCRWSHGRRDVEIGIRELRDGLSKHLALVREGRTLVVTDPAGAAPG